MKAAAIALEIISSMFITLFLYTALAKWIHFQQFVDQMNNQPFDDRFTPFLVWMIPATEICISLLLMFNGTRVWGLYGATLLMAFFTIYVAAVLSSSARAIPCSCGGAIASLDWKQHLWFNLFFVGIGLTGIVLQKRTVMHVLQSSNH
jgi:hypothetical protein